VVDALLLGSPNVLSLAVQRRRDGRRSELRERLLLLAGVHIGQIVREALRLLLVEGGLELLDSPFPGVDVVLDVGRELLNVFVEFFVETEGLHAIGVDLRDLVVAANDDLEVSLSLLLLSVLAVERVRNERDCLHLIFDGLALR